MSMPSLISMCQAVPMRSALTLKQVCAADSHLEARKALLLRPATSVGQFFAGFIVETECC